MSRAGRTLLVAAALAMLSYRFANVDLAAFARDEPQFLAAAREQLRTGHWLSANPLYGNLGLRYGPTAFWFYGVVLALFGDDARVAIVAMGVVVTLAHLALAFAVARVFEEGAVLFAVLVAWIASSPYQFLWSRLAWDLTSNAAAFGAVALLCSYRELRPVRAALLGIVLGLGLSTHPMLAPLALGIFVAVAWELRTRGRGALGPGLSLIAGVVAVNVPYLLFVLKAPVVARAPRQPFSPAGIGTLLLQSPRIATVFDLQYYFSGAWPEFQAWLGRASGALAVLAAVSIVVSFTAAALGIAVTLRAPDARERRVSLAALVTWGTNVLLLAALALELHPHYHFASAWVPVFGLGATLAWLRRHSRRAGAAALALIGVLAVAQFAVLVEWMGFIRASGGTRWPSYGTPVGLEIEAVRAVCAAPDPLVVVRNETDMFPFPLAYLASTEPGCRGKRVIVCSDRPRPYAKPCPPPEAGGRRVRLRYARETGGALAVE